ncbi:hypothetical protein [Pseudomonas aeruginosa]|uniref:hypothetical protein n=1 Tax=Pseudomonas aeruginosa TaxID=287 RepID=UPI0029E24255|nr:hypothetical protein [Pseudomonas aeruginosa]HEK2618706.1 hypothetical protein [Pseudomonas aeruginosa]HEP7980118.1 hypothetical protein [Pseudomonas aeruginosa]HEP8055636.1 hypothetical protein [Pseudomonas aeruginosa]
MSHLMAFRVVHHDSWGEYSSTVIAESKWEASLAVEGKVMHVDDGEDLYAGLVLRSSGWSFSCSEPNYPTVSEEWRQYLIKRHLNHGTEDPRAVA